MLYVRRRACRAPDRKLHDKADGFRWPRPLRCTAGSVVLMLGPLVALVMYWGMLEQLGKHIKAMLAGRDVRAATV